MPRRNANKESLELLKGWPAIAKYLGLSPATAHRWAKAGMPVRREGRFTVAERSKIQEWLGRESQMPKPAHILTGDADIVAALKDSLSVARRTRKK